jgi:hypothetical protein
MRFSLALSVTVAWLLLSAICVSAQVRFDFKTPGSAKSNLGVSKLARIAKRSNMHIDIDQLAAEIEQDNDLVRISSSLSCVLWSGFDRTRSPSNSTTTTRN